ncbi:hypothetical protein ACFOLK_09120 [Marinococcus halophilus]|uniref:Uncharacterized protein n=1 Tax=Marinococcus halophilus TaxID=1371 RepID=A0A510Y4K8_MARHA|nr:hypothetical protein [Marinococcus halophilus]GEK58276.1 hypothetical protein MHA01_11810 [Marinococcus halophilus]
MLIMLMVLGFAGVLTVVNFIPNRRVRKISIYSSYTLFLTALAVLTLG